MPGYIAVELTAPAKERVPLYVYQINNRQITFAIQGGHTPAWLETGHHFVVTLQFKTAVYQFPLAVRTIQVHENQVLFKGILPEWAARVQRRESVRAAINMPATVQTHPQHTPAKLPQVQHCIVQNLSALGMCIEIDCAGSPAKCADTMEMLQKDTIVAVRLPIPALTSSGLLAKVLQAERSATHGGISVRARCQFLSLASWEQEFIVHAVFQAQAQAGRALLKRNSAA